MKMTKKQFKKKKAGLIVIFSLATILAIVVFLILLNIVLNNTHIGPWALLLTLGSTAAFGFILSMYKSLEEALSLEKYKVDKEYELLKIRPGISLRTATEDVIKIIQIYLLQHKRNYLEFPFSLQTTNTPRLLLGVEEFVSYGEPISFEDFHKHLNDFAVRYKFRPAINYEVKEIEYLRLQIQFDLNHKKNAR